MTISYRGGGTAITSGTAVTAITPDVNASATTGDISLLTVVVKPYTATITTPTGWTKVGEITSGTVANGADTGSVKTALYYRISAPPGAIPAIGQTSADTMYAHIVTYACTSGAWDLSQVATGVQAVNGANYSATATSTLNLLSGDWLVYTTGLNSDNGSRTGPTIAGNGSATLGTGTTRITQGTTIGNDSALYIYDRPFTAAQSAATLTFSWTNTSAASGATFFVLLREAAKVTQSSATSWAVRSTVGKTTATAWAVATAVTATTATSWDVGGNATKWVNQVSIRSLPGGSGSTTEVYDPSSAGTGTVTGGTLFTPTAGRLLLCVVYGQVTSTTPSGWSLPTNGSAINAGGLYVFTKTAAGSDTLTTVHNGSGDYPTIAHFMEFPAGSTFVASAQGSGSNPVGSGPTLSGLTGTNLICGVVGQASSNPNASLTAEQFVWAAGVELIDVHCYSTGGSGTRGVNSSIDYLEASTLTSATMAITAASIGSQAERLVFAVNVAGGSTTSVGTTSATSWAVRAPVGKSSATTWSVTATVTDGAATTWSVRTTTPASVATSWSVRTAITDSAVTSWGVRAAVTDTAPTTWAVAATVVDSAATSWAVTTTVGKTTATAWDVAGMLTAVVATSATSWNVVGRVTATAVTSWAVRASAGKTSATGWAVRQAVADSAATSWGVRAAVPDAAATAWSVRVAVTDSAVTQWGVRTAAGTTTATGWGVRGAVTQTAATQWDVGGKPTKLAATSWGVLAAVTQASATTWAVRTSAVATAPTNWSVTAAVTDSAPTAWSILAVVTDTASTSWAARELVAQTAPTSWAAAARPAKTVSTSWNTEADAPLQGPGGTVAIGQATHTGLTIGAGRIRGTIGVGHARVTVGAPTHRSGT